MLVFLQAKLIKLFLLVDLLVFLLFKKQLKKKLVKSHHKGVNPDEVVAMGAAIQGGVLTGDVKGRCFIRRNSTFTWY